MLGRIGAVSRRGPRSRERLWCLYGVERAVGTGLCMAGERALAPLCLGMIGREGSQPWIVRRFAGIVVAGLGIGLSLQRRLR